MTMAATLKCWRPGLNLGSPWLGSGETEVGISLWGWRKNVQENSCVCKARCRSAKHSSYQQASGGRDPKKQQSPSRNGKTGRGRPETGSSKSSKVAEQNGRQMKRSKVLNMEDDMDASVEGLAKVLAKPPAGFVLDGAGNVVLMAPLENRIVSLVDPATKRPLGCVVRRSFLSTDGVECLLVTPVDMALQVLKFEKDRRGVRDLSNEELAEVLPTASYALAKIRLHLVHSGFCLTARGGFCYAEEDVIDLNTQYGEARGGSLAEGVEIISFYFNNAEYLIYTPVDPLMFVVQKDEESGELTIVEDELLDDSAVLEAIDEENDFQAMVDEEEAVNNASRETHGRGPDNRWLV